ncbi:MAG TPA: hypothetical protein V6D08_16315 [Candidatus Obscuribacterales bacterium]
MPAKFANQPGGAIVQFYMYSQDTTMSPVNRQRPTTKLDRVLGKSEARDKFLPLVDELASRGGIVKITAYGKPVAVLMSHNDYLVLRAKAEQPLEPKRALVGCFELVGDLDEASKEVAAMIRKSIARSTNEL